MCREGWWETKYWLSDMLPAHWGVVMKLSCFECLGAYTYKHTVMLQISPWKGFYVLKSCCLRTRGIVLNCASDQKQRRMWSSKLQSHLLYLHCFFPIEPCLLRQDAQGLFYLILYGITAVNWDKCFCRWTKGGLGNEREYHFHITLLICSASMTIPSKCAANLASSDGAAYLFSIQQTPTCSTLFECHLHSLSASGWWKHMFFLSLPTFWVP